MDNRFAYNRLKEKMAMGKCCLGGWAVSSSPVITEIMAAAGFDWVCVDTEHSPLTESAVREMIISIERHHVEPIVRVRTNNEAEFKTYLDLGARGILVPMIKTSEEVEKAISFTKYPPEGTRSYAFPRATGYGLHAESYYQQANNAILFGIMIEHIDAVKNLDSILAVQGIDLVMIGPYDLSGSMNIPGNLADPALIDAIKTIQAKCNEYQINVGSLELNPTPERIENHRKSGIRFLACGTDTSLLIHAMKRFLND